METKEDIKNRMIRTASKIWGYSEINSENDFDPLISLLFNVNAAELERLSNEISLSRARILERMMQIYTPDILTNAIPAHCIIHTESILPQANINPTEQFSTIASDPRSQSANSSTDIPIYFAPTMHYTANPYRIKYLLTKDALYEYKNKISKEQIAFNPNTFDKPTNIWIGLQSNSGQSMADTQFFLNLSSDEEQQMIFNFLPSVKWFNTNNEQITTKKGYQQEDKYLRELDIHEIVSQGKTPSNILNKSINRLYEKQFITLTDIDHKINTTDNSLPPTINNFFAEDVIQTLKDEKLIWIKLEFPENISPDILEQINIYANCFPVVNKKLHDIAYQLQDFVNIIPLHFKHFFFDISSITNTDGNQLHIRHLENEDKQSMEVFMRQGGVARFDERDAKSTIEHIIQLLRDESASFNSLGRNFISNEINELQQVINKLEQQLFQYSHEKEEMPHLLISNPSKKTNKSQSVFVQFWSTLGALGNGIKASTHLVPFKSNDVNYYETYLITSTIGGKNKMNVNEKIHAYKYALLSHDRILSKEDIELFCRLQLGSALQKVEIKNGMRINESITQGYAKTIDIILYIDQLSYLSYIKNGELDFWHSFLLKEISEKSQSLTPFRIFLKESVDHA